LHCEQATLRPGAVIGITFCLTFACTLLALPGEGYPFDLCQPEFRAIAAFCMLAQMYRACRISHTFRQ
jgi:hypothetical protein